MSNILFGKLGQEIIYDRMLPEAIRSNTNGNYESYMLLQMLLDMEHNIFCVNDNIKISFEQQKQNNNLYLITDNVPKINIAFILLGVDKTKVSKKLLNIINSGIKWYALCTDPRCLDALTDLITNPPIEVYAGVNGNKCNIAGKEYDTKYLNIEASNIYKEEFKLEKGIKHNGMIVISNETKTWDRIKDVKEMTSLIPGVIIYGRCNEELMDDRFVGEFPIQHIYNSQMLSKVSYISPIYPGWITAKYLECITRGVIPLMQKEYALSIDCFINDIKNVDENLIVKNPYECLEMYKKIIYEESYYRFLLFELYKNIYKKYGPEMLIKNLNNLIEEVD